MNVLFHLLREKFRIDERSESLKFCVSAGKWLVLSRSKALKLFYCILILNFNFKALEWFWLRLRGIICGRIPAGQGAGWAVFDRLRSYHFSTLAYIENFCRICKEN